MTSIFGGGGVLSANSTPAFKFQELPVIDGQTVFTLTAFSYTPGTQSLWVFLNGQKMVVGVDYNETATNQFTWTSQLTALDTVEAVGVALTSITTDVSTAVATANAAATSATASAATATTAATSATNSATSASTSAGSAGTSASNAATSATAAASSATSAGTSASSASSYASSASNSASIATVQASNAGASASLSSSGAANASASAMAASTSATTATTQAGIATTQAGNASTSATNAAASATAAASSAASAAAAAASGLYRQVLDKTANYTILAADAGTLFRANTGSGAITFTLPQISTVTDGFRVSVVKWTSDGNQAIINRTGSDTINGATSVAISAQYAQVIFVADFETNTWFASQSGLGATSANVDPFTGNGTTGPFTLSVDPGNKNNTDVFFGGVHQDHSTYSITGTALTFTSATPTGVSIEVKYSTPLPIGVPSDNTVTPAKISPTGNFVFPDISYTATLTGGTGIINIGAGQFYKDASGNVGFGTTATTSAKTTVYTGNTGTTVRSTPGLLIQSNGTNTDTNLRFSDSASYASEIGQQNGGMYIATSGLERLRVDPSGNLQVGVSAVVTTHYIRKSNSTGATLTVENTSNTAGSRCLELGMSTNADTTGTFVRCGDFGAYRFQVLGNGNVQNVNNSYGSISDIKFKENITDASPKLAKLNNVRIVNYNLIGDTTKQIGVIAQELEQVFPSMIEEMPDTDDEGVYLGTTTKSVKYSVFVPILIKAIQEQQAIIEQLRADVVSLKEKIGV